MTFRVEWREALNSVSEAYDRYRPRYPGQLVPDLIRLAGLPAGGRILEIGCGTGQLTTELAPLGYRILALEPGPDLARIASRNLATHAAVRIVVTTLEDWDGGPERFDLVVAAQSFHLVEPSRRFQLAAKWLVPGGALAVAYSYRMPGDTPAHRVLHAAYARHAPDLRPDQGNQDTPVEDDFDAAGLFGTVYVARYRWIQEYTGAEYVGLLSSHGTHQMLPEDARTALFGAIADGVAAAGDRLPIEYLTRLYVARTSAIG